MSQVFFLDSGPLGLITHHQRSKEVIDLVEWFSRALLSGAHFLVPAIVYYELKRELLRAEKIFSIGRLDQFIGAEAKRYVPLSDAALKLGAELWARARQQGRPTADEKALDIDVLIAAQALSLGVDVTVVTTNPKHLSQFVSAKHWDEIVV